VGPELDMMLQSGSVDTFSQQWQVSSTPQWNFDGLDSDPFVASGLRTVNTATHLNYLAMATHSGVGLLSYLYFSQSQLRSNLGPPDLSLGIDATPDLVRPSPAP